MKVTFRKAGQCGILVRDAISKDFRDLEERDLRPFQNVVGIAAQATLRIEVSSRALVRIFHSNYWGHLLLTVAGLPPVELTCELDDRRIGQ